MTNVIVIDDDPTNSGLLKMLLELDGFSVETCASLAETEAKITPETKALVIDCNLARGASGLDILRAIRGGDLNTAADTVVIMTSGDYRLEQDSLDHGANKFLLKPYSPNVLSTTLQNLLIGGASGK